MKMNADVLNIIHDVLDYKKHIISHQLVMRAKDFDWYETCKSYFFSLPLPDGMHKSLNTFEKILYFDKCVLMVFDTCESQELEQYEF